MSNPLLLQVVIVAVHLDAKAKSADGVGVKPANIGDDVIVRAGKMSCLLRHLL